MKNNTKRILLLFGGVICLSVVIFLQTNVVRDVGYLTRPIWDKDMDPWNVTSHYYSFGIPPEELCKLHNWIPRSIRPKVFDAVIFSVELDLLEIRLRELWDVVDIFIILESDKTFTGVKKDMIFAKNKDRFSWAEQKIVYRSCNNLEPLEKDESPFKNEEKMRICMSRIISELKIEPGDLVINADVDEIPYSHTIDLVRSCEGYPKELHLELRGYLYSFEFFTGSDSWRANIITYQPGTSLYRHERSSNDILSDAGWHCSFCFRHISDFRFKMASYSHDDRITNKKQLEYDVIQEKICSGKDVFDMLPEAYTYKDLISKLGDIPKSFSFVGMPKYLLKNKDKFSFLLPGGCIRERNS